MIITKELVYHGLVVIILTTFLTLSFINDRLLMDELLASYFIITCVLILKSFDKPQFNK